AGETLLAIGDIRTGTDALGSVVTREGSESNRSRFNAWGFYRTEQYPAGCNPTEPGSCNDRYVVPGVGAASGGFAGTFYDASTGLHYAQQRWLDPTTGTWLSEDPVRGSTEFPVSLQPWVYGSASPVRFTDPSGEIVPFIVAAALIAAEAGFF